LLRVHARHGDELVVGEHVEADLRRELPPVRGPWPGSGDWRPCASRRPLRTRVRLNVEEDVDPGVVVMVRIRASSRSNASRSEQPDWALLVRW